MRLKLSFSTRGWNESSWQENLTDAEDMDFNGVEVYNVIGIPELTDRGGPFHAYAMASTYREMRGRKLESTGPSPTARPSSICPFFSMRMWLVAPMVLPLFTT